MRAVKTLAAFGMLALLAACQTFTLAPAGAYAPAAGYQLTLGRPWSDVSSLSAGANPAVKLLSIDGPLLDRLYVVNGLSPGDFIVKAQAKDKPTPTVRAGMTVMDRIEFVADSVSAMDYERVETARPRPAQFGGHDAVRFDLSARTKEGLDISGTAVAAEVNGKVYVILYLAPTEHYFAAYLPEVESIMASARLG